MKKIIYFLIFLVLVYGCTYKSVGEDITGGDESEEISDVLPSEIEEKISTECSDTNEGLTSCRDKVILKEIISGTNFNLDLCDSISDENLIRECKDGVLMNKATFSGDGSICNEILDENTKDRCKNLVK